MQMSTASESHAKPLGTGASVEPNSPTRSRASKVKDDPLDVVFRANYGVRVIELNRPRKLHSLDASMIRKILPRLNEYTKSDLANVIILTASGSKAFCAGGDVASIASLDLASIEGYAEAVKYFAEEYKLDHFIATCQKPLISFMDGITMGGGVGLSMHTPFRIATENTVWAMPETTIGFFPDVGASFFLPRLPGAMGTYLALTSEKVKGVNAFYTGIATHYMHSATLRMLEDRLAELRFQDYDSYEKRLNLISTTMEEYATGLPHDQPMIYVGELRKAIDRCFSHDTVPAILDALASEQGETQEWAQQTIASLRTKSPTSLVVSLRLLRLSQAWKLSEAFFREHQLAAKFMNHPDFKEGVSALLIRKDGKPQWKPATVEEVTNTDDFFRIDPQINMDFMQKGPDYAEYPFPNYGVPREADLETSAKQKGVDRSRLLGEAMQAVGSKQGAAQVVREILSRRVVVEDRVAKWVD